MARNACDRPGQRHRFNGGRAGFVHPGRREVYTAGQLLFTDRQIAANQGRISSVVTTPGTARFDVAFGSNVVADGLAILLDSVAGHTDVGWSLEFLLTCRAIGATANLMQSGIWVCEDILGVPASAPKGVLTALLPWNAAPAVGANFDSTASQVVDLFFTQTAATGSLQVHQYSLESLN